MHLKVPAKKCGILVLKSLFRPENEAFETRTRSWQGRIGIIWLCKFGIEFIKGERQLRETEIAYQGLFEDEKGGLSLENAFFRNRSPHPTMS
jgi:hypothetical protein